jgi:hypothetical protein
MSYISTQINRFCSAFCDSTFWAEILVIIPLSLLGIWWPVLFEWSGYQSYFMPAVWFTFGLGSLATIFIRRSLLPESKDDFKIVNTIFITILCLVGALLYGKSLITNLNGNALVEIFCGIDLLGMAIILNIFVWIWNLISNSDFDTTNAGNSLGDSYD